jgi:hypothetical protein
MWRQRFGKWWMVQWLWPFDGWLSFGIHIDLKPRRRPDNGERYGPYMDVHAGIVILSLGYNPYHGVDYERGSVGRGGNAWTVIHGNN